MDKFYIKKIIQTFKNIRKQNYLNTSYKNHYAFVGIGNHSINNLYPVINYLRIPLKYIATESVKSAQKINLNFSGITAVSDLDIILNDADINGVFICTQPEKHPELIKRSLNAGKNVFVEKPPCSSVSTLRDLIEIERFSRKTCVVGLQRRYSPYYALLKKKMSHVHTYNFRYLLGNYPEGDPILDLYIHPIDIICFLFGEGKIQAIQPSANKKTLFLQVQHQEVIGTIELSTDYFWNLSVEELVINTNDGVFNLRNCNLLTYTRKSGTLMGFPREKIFNTYPATYTLLNRSGFLPVLSNNEVYAAGYFDEINNFIRICENQKAGNNSSLEGLINTYQLMDDIKKYLI